MKQIEKGLRNINRKTVYWLFIAFIFGGMAAFWARFTLVQRSETHFHANFAVYISGEREKFESFTFYEEIAACSPDSLEKPATRVHMHDSISHVVHVHDKAVTWGNFFENLGYTLGNRVLDTQHDIYIDGTYIDGNPEETTSRLRFILNGKLTDSIANQVINSEDVLLIDFSADSEDVLMKRYSEITRDAAEYNQRQDPSACQGGKAETFTQRLKRTIGVE